MTAVLAPVRARSSAGMIRNASIVFLVVALASLFGILTRPAGFLAAVWPANAILLGMMVRNPSLSSAAGWAAAFAGYISADMATGGELLATLWLTLANIMGAYVGYVLFMRLPTEDRRLRRPISIVYMFAICALAAGAAGIAGSGAANLLFGSDVATGFAFWFTTELVNMIILLPVIFTVPSSIAWPKRAWSGRPLREWLPALTFAASMMGSLLAGGPGAFTYPIPALLWCALSYGLFGTAILTLVFSIVQLIAAAAGLMPFPAGFDELMTSVSIRLAIALIALGPLAVASINATREEALRKLQYAASHDCLTKALVRSVFMQRGEQLLAAAGGRRPEAAVMMIDIDHFKSVNDCYGHAAGDRVLAGTAHAIMSNLRGEDLIGRLGGEEFGIILARSSQAEAERVAERIRAAVDQLAFDVAGATLRVTVSIGLAAAQGRQAETLYTLLAGADEALYRAKAAGRNRVIAAPRALAVDQRFTA